ncbi:MAG: polymerase sigma-70 factor, subfamily [Acidobacteriota bacterium]|jgi:RNA polymerase sigma-70 factor (ECF subfamily)|nr:polymerase sigma-70 factor, subfamily [Acidobacteriota bacterium]
MREADHSGDLTLVERMLAGDEKAFEAFGDLYFKALYRFVSARLKGDRELIREIVQAAVTKALSRLDTYRGEASLLTWLCSCCRNEMLMCFRRRRTAPDGLELTEELEPAAGFGPQGPGDPETVLLTQERALRVHMALDGLPEHYAQALEWKYLDSVPVNEIASRMGTGPKAAESLLTRARQAFRRNYEDHGRTGSDD